MRRWWIVALVVILALAGATMWRERAREAATAAPPTVLETPAPAGALRRLDLDAPALRIEVLSITRLSRDIVDVRLALTNRDAAAPLTLGDRFAESPAETGTLSAAFLTTAAGTSRTFVLRDASGAPQCSTGLGQLGPGERREAWIRFASPTTAVGLVTLSLRNVPPLDGLVLPGTP